jgi:hypothetical protein
MKTILAHFYNEEYLLPWWLEHHKQIFDHGVMIDYNSTDRSREIIKEICPDWAIIDTVNTNFDPSPLEVENNKIQSIVPGWRIFLNITEFLVGDVEALCSSTEKHQQINIPVAYFFDWNPDGPLDRNKKLWEQLTTINTAPEFLNARLLHNGNAEYWPGRHCHIDVNVNAAKIFKYNNCISSPEMLNRRLQTQKMFSKEVMQTQAGWQHHNYGNGLTKEILAEYHSRYSPFFQNDHQMIENYAKFHQIDQQV